MLNSTLCYIEKDGKYLLLHRTKKKNDINEGKWIGVGGKFEPGETAEQCLVREVYEETGLTLTEYTMVGVVKFYSDQNFDQDMYLYKGTDFTGNLKEDCPEGDLQWVPKEEVLKKPTWEGDHLFLEPLLAGRTNLNMTVRYKEDKLVEFIDDTSPVTIETSKLIKSPHGFSTRIGGVSEDEFATLNLGMKRGDSEARVTENYRRFFEAAGISNKSFMCGNQVHGAYVHTVRKEDLREPFGKGNVIEADGYVTNLVNAPLVVFTADCVPVLLEDYKAGVIAAVHCGWKSTVQDIEGVAIGKMIALGANPENIRAAIGPSIDICSFEVGGEVIDAVKALLKTDSSNLYYQKENGKYMLDLRGVVALRLEQLGLRPENMERVGGCTLCHPERYFSHRYSEGRRGSLAAVIELK